MPKFEDRLIQLEAALFDVTEVRAFLSARQEINGNAELMDLDQKRREAQRLMGLHLNEADSYQRYRDLYDEYTKRYEEHPLIKNYEYLKESVSLLLNQIKDILSI